MWCIFAQHQTEYRRDVPTDHGISRVTGAPRWMLVVSIALVTSLAGALGIVRATNSQMDQVGRVSVVTPVLSPASDGFENYLLVGSDSRASAAEGDEDFAVWEAKLQAPANALTRLIVVHVNTKDSTVTTMSIPRDLWARMGDSNTFKKINSAYQRGPDVLVRTVQRALNIPIHHYVEVNFSGFKEIVDAIGGVRICVPRASRDKYTGFFIGRKACKLQSGADALRYARARHLEEKIDGRWKLEPTGDVGRGNRQRAFMSMLAKDTALFLARHPMKTSTVLTAFASAVSVDDGLDLIDLGRKLRPMGDGTAKSYALPVDSDMSTGSFTFSLNNDAQPLLAFFAGLATAPVVD
jgi:polyisoprenyl-teichoic acid--peptidoglycan teichoic acid transferase